MRKELARNPYSSIALAKEVREVVRSWPYQYLRPIIYGYDILWVCFLMSMCSVRCGLYYRISSCNFNADWTIVMGKISFVGLALANSELATTDLPEHSHQPEPDFIFPKCSFG